MVLHLRYPNAHTHWFSSFKLHLFHEIENDRFREVMTRVLLERFLVHRPHPWGALVTFIELLRNPKYDFWNHEFIRVAPEVTLLLETVRLLLPRSLTSLLTTHCRLQGPSSNPRLLPLSPSLSVLYIRLSSHLWVLFSPQLYSNKMTSIPCVKRHP